MAEEGSSTWLVKETARAVRDQPLAVFLANWVDMPFPVISHNLNLLPQAYISPNERYDAASKCWRFILTKEPTTKTAGKKD